MNEPAAPACVRRAALWFPLCASAHSLHPSSVRQDVMLPIGPARPRVYTLLYKLARIGHEVVNTVEIHWKHPLITLHFFLFLKMMDADWRRAFVEITSLCHF